MTDRIGGYDKSFTATYQQIAQTRTQGADDSSKSVRFKNGKAYVHKGLHGFNFRARARKKEAGAQAVFRAIKNQFGEEVASKVFHRITGSAQAGGSLNLGQLDAMNHILKTNVSTSVIYKQSTAAELDGAPHVAQYDAAFKEKVEEHANDGVTRDLDALRDMRKGKPGQTNWFKDDKHSSQYVHRSFQRDFMGATFLYKPDPRSNDSPKVLADANDKSVLPQNKMQDCVKTLNDSGIPPEHWPVLTATLNQGLFEAHQGPTRLDPKSSPMPFQFGDGKARKDLAGVKFEFQPVPNRPGCYDFVATSQQSMANISDVPDPHSRARIPNPDRTDDSKSEYTVQISGRINCMADEETVTIHAGQAGYKATLAE